MGRLAQYMILMIANSQGAVRPYLVDLLDLISILFFYKTIVCASGRLGANEVMASILTKIC